MLVGEIMHSDVKTASTTDSFADVAKTMHAKGISSVVVLDGKKLGDRDRARHREPRRGRRRPAHTTVEHGMTPRPAHRHVEDRARGGDGQMVSRNIRHLPVVDGDEVVGIVSIRDMTRWAAEELSGGHEMPDIAGSHAALQAASELQRKRGA